MLTEEIKVELAPMHGSATEERICKKSLAI